VGAASEQKHAEAAAATAVIANGLLPLRVLFGSPLRKSTLSAAQSVNFAPSDPIR